jgi:hypothetical protein
LVAPEASAPGDISAVQATEVADKIVKTVANNLGMTTRHAINIAAAQSGKIDVNNIGGVERASDYRARTMESELRPAARNYQPGASRALRAASVAVPVAIGAFIAG